MGGYKHGLSYHPLYELWGNMKSRCHYTNGNRYKHYGGRGIIVCKEWKNDPTTFIKWALAHGWEKGLCIDRIDNDGNYESGNCRFVNIGLNNRNQRLLSKRNKTGYRGISFHKQTKKYRSRIRINNKEKHLGLFKTPIEAAIAYDSMAVVLNDGRPTNF